MNIAQHKLIETLYLEMYDMLKIYARCSLEEESLAEEAVQETFRVACQKPEQLFKSPNPRGWLVNTLKNIIRNMKRTRENTRQLLSRYVAAQTKDFAVAEDKISLEAMYENIADTEAFRLIKEMAIDGRSHLEMATARGITVAACKKRVQRAKATLRKKL